MDVELWKVIGSNVTVAGILILWVRVLIVEKKEQATAHIAERVIWAQVLKEKDNEIKELNKQGRTDAQGTLEILKTFEKTLETTTTKDQQEREKIQVLIQQIITTTLNIVDMLKNSIK